MKFSRRKNTLCLKNYFENVGTRHSGNGGTNLKGANIFSFPFRDEPGRSFQLKIFRTPWDHHKFLFPSRRWLFVTYSTTFFLTIVAHEIITSRVSRGLHFCHARSVEMITFLSQLVSIDTIEIENFRLSLYTCFNIKSSIHLQHIKGRHSRNGTRSNISKLLFFLFLHQFI